jgi:AcrR family transcriptional regulator
VVESLRTRQKQIARELMLRAAADLIAENGLEAVSLAEVAERAGVAKRTLYNYFESREVLFAELSNWSDELTLQQGGYLVPEGLESLPDMIQVVWRTWAAQGTIHQAAERIGNAASPTGISPGRARSRAALADAIIEVSPDIDADHANGLAALIHAFTSAPVFERLTLQDGLDVETAGPLIGWAIRVLSDALKRSDHPFGSDASASPRTSTEPSTTISKEGKRK